MTEQDARMLIAPYAVSYYAGEGGSCSASEVRKAKEELRAAGVLLDAMEENIAEAKVNYESVRLRYKAAIRDGLFDLEALETLDTKGTKKTHEAWAKAIETQTGDKVRAISELRHWREYWYWEKRAGHVEPMALAQLAEAKS